MRFSIIGAIVKFKDLFFHYKTINICRYFAYDLWIYMKQISIILIKISIIENCKQKFST